MFQDGLLRGKRVLVTGGGTGLGREIAEEYLRLGAAVYICGRRGAVLEETAAELTARHGGTVCHRACDIRDAAAVDALVQWCWDDGGPLTGLVNNAAGNFVSRTEDLSPRGFDAVANIVMHGSFYVTHAVGRRWIADGVPGSVISILVTWIHNGGPYVVPSAMSKAGLHAMTMSLAAEWGRHGIRLNAIAPGEFPTPGMSARLSPTGEDPDKAARNPMRRLGRMPELRNLATFLMADGVEWLTGQVIAMDGASHLASGGNFYEKFREWSDDDWQRARDAIKARNAADKAARTA